MNFSSVLSKGKNLLLASTFAATAIFSTSCGESTTNMEIAGVRGPNLELLEDNIRITTVLENVALEGGLTYAIPEYNDSYIEISPDLQSDGTLITINIAAADLLDTELQTLDPQMLPGGRPLPGVASGTLPAVAFTVQSLKNMTFYLGPEFFGTFIPFPLDIGTNNIVTARFYSGEVRAGNVSAVGPDKNGENSGMLILLDLSSSVKRGLEKVARKYN